MHAAFDTYHPTSNYDLPSEWDPAVTRSCLR
jgi:hypothetical protein